MSVRSLSYITEIQNYEDFENWLKKHNVNLSVIDRYDNTFLHLALNNDNVKPIEFLINSNRIDIHARNKSGYSVLRWASILGYPNAVRVLLTKFDHSEVAQDDFNMSYISALIYGRKEVLEILDGTPFGHGDAIKKMIYISVELVRLAQLYNHFDSRGATRRLVEVQNRLARLEFVKKQILEKIPGYQMSDGILYYTSKVISKTLSTKLLDPSKVHLTVHLKDEDQLPLDFIHL